MTWQETEKNIQLYIDFLRENIDASPFHQNDPIKCPECILRQIALAILTRNISIKKVKINKKIKDLVKNKNIKAHGSGWHNNFILVIEEYLKERSVQSIREANLYFGRSDVYLPSLKLYLEVGTISLYKLFINILNMKDCLIHIIPNDEYFLEIKL